MDRPASRRTAPRQRTLELIIERVGAAIVGGQHPPGSSLPPEPALCGQLGVSRTVVREAIKSLVAKGLLVSGPKLGTRVRDPEDWNWFDPQVIEWRARDASTGDFLRELQELRGLVEPAAARFAALRADARDIASMEAAYAAMSEAVARAEDGVAAELRFHRSLLRASRNRMLMQTANTLDTLLRAAFEVAARRPEALAAALDLHRAVLDAVIERAPAKAEIASRLQIDGARKDIEQLLARRGRSAA